MEPHTQTDDTPNSRSIIEGQIRECFGRVVYTHKTHEKCADILLYKLDQIKIAQIILSALTTAGFIAAIFGTGKVEAIFGAIVSTLLLGINAYVKDYDLGELAQKHRQSASDLWIIREKYITLITDIRMGERPIEGLQTARDELLKELHSVYSGAPSTNYKAYKRAQEALQKQEEMTFSDGEIDAFLPKDLRSTARNSQESKPA